jgi:hypothetical protein
MTHRDVEFYGDYEQRKPEPNETAAANLLFCLSPQGELRISHCGMRRSP